MTLQPLKYFLCSFVSFVIFQKIVANNSFFFDLHFLLFKSLGYSSLSEHSSQSSAGVGGMDILCRLTSPSFLQECREFHKDLNFSKGKISNVIYLIGKMRKKTYKFVYILRQSFLCRKKVSKSKYILL